MSGLALQLQMRLVLPPAMISTHRSKDFGLYARAGRVVTPGSNLRPTRLETSSERAVHGDAEHGAGDRAGSPPGID